MQQKSKASLKFFFNIVEATDKAIKFVGVLVLAA
jgi:hypothetical protein